MAHRPEEPSTTTPSIDHECDDYLLPIDNIKAEVHSYNEYNHDDQLSPKLDYGLTRGGPRTSFFSHLTILGVMSVLIVCSMIPSEYFAGRAFGNKLGVSHPVNVPKVNRWSLEFIIDSIFQSTSYTDTLKTGAQIVFGGAYAIYFVYVAYLIIKEKVKRN